MLKTKKRVHAFLILCLMTTSVKMNAAATLAKWVTAFSAGFFGSHFIQRFEGPVRYRKKFAPQHVQDKAEQMHQKLEALCEKYAIIGQFVVNFDRSKKKPSVYFNMQLGKDSAGQVRPGNIIHMSDRLELTKEKLENAFEGSVLRHEVVHCVLGHQNIFSSLFRSTEQTEFEAETVTVFSLLFEKKFDSLRGYFSRKTSASNICAKDLLKEKIHYELGQINGIAAFKKEFPNSSAVDELLTLLNEKNTQASKALLFAQDFEFTKSYKKAKKQLQEFSNSL